MLQTIKIQSIVSVIITLLLVFTPLLTMAEPPTNLLNDRGDWIVTLADDANILPAQAARQAVARAGGSVGAVYEHALQGYAVRNASRRALERMPGVTLVEPDIEMTTFAQTQIIPTGVKRIGTKTNSIANINGQDQRVDVDIAVIDSGIQLNHPDLNVVAGADCTRGPNCFRGGDGNDTDGHGTHVAGTIAALDNGYGVVGVAPGARLWSVKVLNGGTGSLSDVIKGVDYVTANADQIDIANMSLGGVGYSSAFRSAIQASVAKGVVYIVAAGNEAQDIYGHDGKFDTVDSIMPAAFPEVATISAMVDTDGKPGGLGGGTTVGGDDSFATFSNYSASVVAGNPVQSEGAAIDMMMPGVLIYSTWINGGYYTISGTSMAAPHAAGLAALAIAANGTSPTNATEVAALRQQLIDSAKAQDSSFGLATLNDPDENFEPLGYAGESGDEPVNQAPIAHISSDKDEVLVGKEITFDGRGSEGNELSYEWNFGDGATATGSVVTHTYVNLETYTVTLTVTDADGATASTTKEVEVKDIEEVDDPASDSDITLSLTGYKERGRNVVDLRWSGVDTESVDIYRNGSHLVNISNSGQYTDNTGERGGATYTYQVCESGTKNCSPEQSFSF